MGKNKVLPAKFNQVYVQTVCKKRRIRRKAKVCLNTFSSIDRLISSCTDYLNK